MLEYENQILLDLLHEDGLLILAKGMGLERILAALLTSYSDPGNLVIVIGTSAKDEEYMSILLEEMEVTPKPKSITSDCSISDRKQMYLGGGCLFVTSRILVVDLLVGRVPVDLITGIIVWRAHKVIESAIEAFILRLYRKKNKTGFIKALSSSPLSYTMGFCHVERVMKNLFVKKLYLWPRFHVDICNTLNQRKPEVIELHLKMTSSMQQIQLCVLDLISVTLQELKLSNRAINIEPFSTENAISPFFDKIIKLQLDPIWHQLSVRTRQLVADMKVLRTILIYLTQYDCITFYNLVNSLHTTEKAMQSAGWLLNAAADTLFIHAKRRVYFDWKPPSKDEKNSDCAPKSEMNPKWLVLTEILNEIKEECSEGDELQKCLIVTEDHRTENQLKNYLVEGGEQLLRSIFFSTIGQRLGLTPPQQPPNDSVAKKPVKNDSDTITLTQITKKYDGVPACDNDQKSDKIEATERKCIEEKNLNIYFESLKNNNPFALLKMLEEIRPKYIIMYDSDLRFVRQIEVWQAATAEISIRVYFLIYKGTTEEQIYLTSIKKEKDAFEFLIKEKSNMVLPEYVDGRSEDHPELHPLEDELSINSNAQTRSGGRGLTEEKVIQSIVVDMREFRSDLPSILHKRGIEIEPATIEVGDYILTPEVCVERKSLSDLIGSLKSGRLYNQAQTMTRFYKKPVLLIEFDYNKPFYLQGRFLLSNDSSSNSKDVRSRLILLTLHFPHLRLLWSPSPYTTAELFLMLKVGKENPVVENAQAIKSDTETIDKDKFNPRIKDFLSKLPGITSKNIFSVLRRVAGLNELVCLSKDELSDTLGNSKQADQLYHCLNGSFKDMSSQEQNKGRIKKKFGKPLHKKFKSR